MDEEQQDRVLMVELGMPSDATPVRFTSPPLDVEKKGQSYRFELFGRYVESAAEETASGLIVRFNSRHKSKNGLLLQIWRQTVTCRGFSTYGELRWHPETGEQIAIRGLVQAASKREIDLIWEGVKLFPLVREKLMWRSSKGNAFITQGRPVGSVVLTQTSFFQLAVEAYKKLHDLKVQDVSKHPTQQEVAQELLISRQTVIRYLKNYDILWSDIRKKATGLKL